MSVGAVIANTGNATAYSVDVSVTLLSAEGMALDTSNETLTFLHAGETGYVVTEHLLPAEPAVASLDVTGSSSADEGFMAVAEIVAPTADVRVTAESFGGSVRGSLTNPMDEVVDSLKINCIVRDGGGATIGGGYTYSDTIAPGATVAFETSLSEQVAARAAGAECRAAGTSITSVG